MDHVASDNALLEILSVATAISGAADLRSLLHLILVRSRALTSADAGSIFLIEKARKRPFGSIVDGRDPGLESDRLCFAVSQNASLDTRLRQDDRIEDAVGDIRVPITTDSLVGWCALQREVLNIPDAYALDPSLPYHFDPSLDRQLGYRSISMLTVPLRTTADEVVGVLQLINRKKTAAESLTPETASELTQPFTEADQELIEALASLAAVCVQRTQLLEAQEKLIDSIIGLIANAIDAKSPYTGGHCERVPELAVLLAEAAESANRGPLADFSFGSPEAWREFRIGAWLHDCGKVTTPEYVVDKATKLETKYNRIHEIRTRFEVLLRDARIAHLQGLLAGGEPTLLDRELAEREAELAQQFEFVAASNLGDESFPDEHVERLKSIGEQRWCRHFDDTLGLSWEELERRKAFGPDPAELPWTESLLADSPWHAVTRQSTAPLDSNFGFKMDIPELEFNFGELYNLSIRRGTLTPEERFKINEHIIQTIVILERLPFPAALSRVAEYAGTHHETLRGDGYPRRLGAAELSVPARIMAIADIFEALTAADRPYKRAKKLSESVAILADLRDRGHIDADLFELFLTSGVYLQYAERYLQPQQIDHVDIGRYLSPAAT